MISWTNRLNKAISFCFYCIFFLVPLVMFPATYELFEFNKMWTIYGIALIILFLWVSKIIITQEISITRTPLDIPILLFLASQIISTIFSLDPHVSFWGYYSRFNGGLLSILTYIFLYYAFASNILARKKRGDLTERVAHMSEPEASEGEFGSASEGKAPSTIGLQFLKVSLVSGAIVALWGFPSHFGYDPTCFVFRGTLDVSCWTEAFQPKVRIFSTLGQPNWLAAYLAILIPIVIALGIKNLKLKTENLRLGKLSILYLALSFLFYVDLLWTSSQSGFLGFWVGNIVFVLFFLYLIKRSAISFSALFKQKLVRLLIFINIIFLLTSFIIGFPIQKLNQFKFSNLIDNISQQKQKEAEKKIEEKKPQGPLLESGGTDSGKIRRIVWTGAIEIFKQNPLFGTGVETFAYAYYKVKPREHNLTSEWDFLYNKAHNEYLNYLATTGIFGLGSYLLMIGWFFFGGVKWVVRRNTSNISLLALALIASYISILVSNFFGFSVVIVNLYFFLIPIIFYSFASPESLKDQVLSFTFAQPPHSDVRRNGESRVDPTTTTFVMVAALIILLLEFMLFQFWRADIKYALGYNLDKAGDYVQANKYLTEAAKIRQGERLYKDELSVNLSTLSLALTQENNSTGAALLAKQAKDLSDEVILHHPNNITYYKSRTRVLYSLSELEPSLISEAVAALKKGEILAPNDVKVLYNLGLLYQQTGDINNTIKYLKKTIEVKPDYRDAYYALALYYSEIAKEEKDSGKAQEYKNEARELLEYTLKSIEPNDPQAKELLENLK